MAIRERQQSSTAYPIPFFMADATDGITGKTGLAPTVTLSKNNAAFAAAAGAVTEIGNGWYSLAGNATDRNTLGALLLHATATGAQPVDLYCAILAIDPFDANMALARLDAAVSSRAAIADYTTARAAKLDNLDATVSSRSSHTAADVWAAATRTLSAFGFGVTVATNNDKTGYGLSAAAVQAIWDAATSALTTAGSIGKRIADNLDATVSSRLAASGYTAPDNADVVAIRAKTDNLPAAPAAVSDVPSAATVAAAVWSAGARTLTAFGFSVDLSAAALAAIWDRATSALVTAGSVGKRLADNLDAAVSSRLAGAGYTAPDNAGIAAATAAATATLARTDVATSTRLAGSAYTAPPSAAAVSTQVWSEPVPGAFADGSAAAELVAGGGGGSSADPLANPVPGTYAEGTAGAALGRLGSAQVQTVSPVSWDGSRLEVVRGDDYAAADNRALVWSEPESGWPPLNGATITFTARAVSSTLVVTGSAPVAAGAHKRVQVELAAADTALLVPGIWRFDVQAALAGGHIVTLVLGRLTVLADVTYP